jgi:hypothetical protein
MPKSKTKDTQGFKNESDPVDAKEQEVIDMLEEEIGTEQMSKTTFLTYVPVECVCVCVCVCV